MNTDDFWTFVQQHQLKLRDLIEGYHPAQHQPRRSRLPVTAPAAQEACTIVSNKIAFEELAMPLPTERFDVACESKDCLAVYGLLQSAWFGVPESTSCWQIPGFKEAVELLEDPPEEAPL